MTDITTCLGYLACLFLFLSLMEKNELRFRWLNIMGDSVFIIYGMLLYAFPVIATNLLLLGVNIYCLYRLYTKKELFEIIEVKYNEVLAERFISFNKNDIKSYFPEFNIEDLRGNFNFIVFRDFAIANMFSVRHMTGGRAEVMLNYTIPKYRDFKVGRFIFETEKKVLVDKGIRYLFYRSVANPKHRKFLEVNGFVPNSDGSHMKILVRGT